MQFQYKKDFDKEKRIEQCKALLIREPDKIPIILEKAPDCKLEPLKKKNFLIKKNLSITKFIDLIRKKMQLKEEEALFLSAKGKYSITGEKTIADLYKNYKDKEDGFLYIVYSSVEVFG